MFGLLFPMQNYKNFLNLKNNLQKIFILMALLCRYNRLGISC